jgi:hypothetical protein
MADFSAENAKFDDVIWSEYINLLVFYHDWVSYART